MQKRPPLNKRLSPTPTKSKPQSKFDWKNSTLHLHTVITDNNKNSENVHAFFQKRISPSFKFNVQFMNWMKTNVGKTLTDAIAAWNNFAEQ